MNILRSLYDIIREITSPPAPDVNVEIVSMWFHLPGTSSWFRPPYQSFWPGTTRLMCELDLRTVRWEPTRLYKLVFRCTPELEDKLLWEDHHDLRLTGRQQFSLETGWDKPGPWPPGHYKIQLLLDGVEVGQSRILYIEQPPPPPPPIEMLQQPSVKFYEWEAGSARHCIRFPKQAMREVICALKVRYLLYGQKDWTYRLTAQCYTSEDKLLWEDHRDWLITSQEPSTSWWLDVWQWPAGIYRLDILIDGKDFAWGAFILE